MQISLPSSTQPPAIKKAKCLLKSIELWQAFTEFVALYTQKKPGLIMQLCAYQTCILGLMQKDANLRHYDQAFRQVREGKRCRWVVVGPVLEWDAYFQAFQGGHARQPFQACRQPNFCVRTGFFLLIPCHGPKVHNCKLLL